MTGQWLVVALEGPCCAGKTTLSRRLAAELTGLTVAAVPCYADHAGGGRFLPRAVAESAGERLRALDKILTIEAERLARVPPGTDLVLADRSVHTLLAHSYALQRLTGTGFFAPSVRLLRDSAAPAWPDLVVYLDIPQHAVHERNGGKFPAGSIFIDPDFNAAIRTYFCCLAARETPRVAWLDATLDLAGLAELAVAQIGQLAQQP